jgi:large subunit ribosomal protein L23
MNLERIHQIILAPVISEKSTTAADLANQVVFEVLIDATKPEIRQAVEHQFNVTVEDIQVVNVRGKMKRFGRSPGKRRNWKKAYVRLAEGQDIDFMGAGA